jgi:hypothetical protein
MKTGNEFLHVVLDYGAICLKLPTDLIDDGRFRRSAFEEFKDARPDRIEVEHLTLLDVENYGSILVMGTANGIGDSVHRNSSSRILFAHSDTSRESNPQKGENFRQIDLPREL